MVEVVSEGGLENFDKQSFRQRRTAWNLFSFPLTFDKIFFKAWAFELGLELNLILTIQAYI